MSERPIESANSPFPIGRAPFTGGSSGPVTIGDVRAARFLLLPASILLALAGCSSDAGAPTTTTDDPSVTDPRLVAEQAATGDPEQFAFGQEVTLTDTGFTPATLVAVVDEEITVRNDSSEPLTLAFTNGPFDDAGSASSPTIAPGSSWSFTPARVVSHAVVVAEHPERAAILQIDPGTFEG